MRIHYPRTPHLPWSPGASADDVRVGGLAGFAGREVVVTEKLDGENTTMYADGLHARSLDSAHHPSRTWIKGLHARIARSIPESWRLCGENLFARHSIAYEDLDSWFYAFSVWNGDHCLDWDQTTRFTRKLGVPVPRVLWRGLFDERALRSLRLDPARVEGYVVRATDGFPRADFPHRVAKWVRPAHVTTDEHWMLAPVIPNGLGPSAALWDVRSGGIPDASALLTATGINLTEPPTLASATRLDSAEPPLTDVATRLDLLGRTGDARLSGVLATLFHSTRRSWLAPHLVSPLGMPLARRVADLAGLHTKLHDPLPDESRRSGLTRLAFSTDLGILHAVSAALATTPEARDQVEWSELHAEEANLLVEHPFEPLRTALREKVGGKGDIADLCWAETREAYALGRISTADEGLARSWNRLSGDFPRLIVTIGPSGSGKSTFAQSFVEGSHQAISTSDHARHRSSRRAIPASDQAP
ncbi:RNA ligase family protein, partial [Acrocarpospora phusangensis]|uniref:RNA ligase family protein n=1 Tax=Acrocarpospora phusangensis TaxID=1070424 RepID=UPI00194F89CE